jgi:hypothetical protein
MRFSWFGVNWVKDTGELAADAASAHPPIPDYSITLRPFSSVRRNPPTIGREGGSAKAWSNISNTEMVMHLV